MRSHLGLALAALSTLTLVGSLAKEVDGVVHRGRRADLNPSYAAALATVREHVPEGESIAFRCGPDVEDWHHLLLQTRFELAPRPVVRGGEADFELVIDGVSHGAERLAVLDDRCTLYRRRR